jgi:uncharacterized damage-inducible protein DinB
VTRTDPPHHGCEREILEGFLEYQRSTVFIKARGLSDADAAKRLLPSLTTVTGLVRHLTDVERYWFREVLLGEAAVPFRYSKEDPDGEFRVTDANSLDAELIEYSSALDEARKSAALLQLDDRARDIRGDVSLRWVLVHMIEETARHLGHLDLLRELLDGETGE